MPRLAAQLERHQIAVYLIALAVGALVGLAAPGADDWLEAAIYPVLGALLYVTFLRVPFTELRAAFADRRFLVAALALNFVLVPPVAFGLSRLAPDGTAVELGVLMVLLTPCIDYVIVFTRLAGGSERRPLAAAPLLMLAQMALLPVYLWLFLGSELSEIVEPGPFIEAFAFLIALPLTLAWATEAWAHRSPAGAGWKTRMDELPVALMAVTLLVVVASQLPRVRDDIDQIAFFVPLYAAFLALMALVGIAAARAASLDAPASRALVFTGATRNSLVILPLALALPDRYELNRWLRHRHPDNRRARRHGPLRPRPPAGRHPAHAQDLTQHAVENASIAATSTRAFAVRRAQKRQKRQTSALRSGRPKNSHQPPAMRLSAGELPAEHTKRFLCSTHRIANYQRVEHPVSMRFSRWRDPDSNRGHHDFQSCALPTELSRRSKGRRAPRHRSALARPGLKIRERVDRLGGRRRTSRPARSRSGGAGLGRPGGADLGDLLAGRDRVPLVTGGSPRGGA